MKTRYVWPIAALICLVSTPLFAGNAPAGLHNKSIVLSWSETNMHKRVSDGQTGTATPSLERTIYISSAGREFVRQKASSGRNGRSGEGGPERTSGRFTFAGNTMVNMMGGDGLLRRLTVTFNPAFSGCQAAITIGKNGAHPVTTGVDGATYEVLSISAGAVSCSIRDGNAFAG